MSGWDGSDDPPLELDLDYSWNTPDDAPKPAAAPPPRAPAPAPPPRTAQRLPDPAFGSADDDSLDIEPLELDDGTPMPTIGATPNQRSSPVLRPPPSAPPMPEDPHLELDVPGADASIADDLAAPPPAGGFACPKCGFAQSVGLTCVACGIVFAKIKAPRETSGVGAPPRATSGVAATPGVAAAPVMMGAPVEAAPPVLDVLDAPSPIVTGPARIDGSFWSEVLTCLIAPFKGMGALWLVILTVVLVVAAFLGGLKGLLLKLGYIGLLANYFAKCAGRAMDGERSAPPLEKPNDIQSEYILPGLALIGLSLILWTPAIFTMGSIVWGAMSSPAAVLDGDAPLEEQIDGWNPDEVFRFQDGDFRTFAFDDVPAIVKRSDGNWVKVIPDEGILLIIGPDYDPRSGDPFGGQDSLYGEDGEVAMQSDVDEDAELAAAWAELDFPVGKLLLFVLFCFLALYYWPMGLAVAALGESIVRTFDPRVVIGCAVRAGLPYLVVVGAGFVVVMLAMLIASQLSWVLATIVTLGSVAYNAGAQGFLMGWLIAKDPELEAAVAGR